MAPFPEIDADRLVRQSLPRGGWGRGVLLLPPAGLLSMLAAVGVLLLWRGGGAWPAVISLSLLGVSLLTTVLLGRLANAARGERREVDGIEELLALRRFPQAAEALGRVLGRPMRLPPNRSAALANLARLLHRRERFDEAVAVADAVLESPFVDPATRFALGCGRSMALLRADRLFDANRAIDALRREVGRLDEAVRRFHDEVGGDADPPPFDSAALTLVEMYRDVQTRHDAEVLATFASKRTALRDALGVRLADPLAMAAVSAARLGEGERAAQLWANATALASPGELWRRYPETAEISDLYEPAPRPKRPNAGEGDA